MDRILSVFDKMASAANRVAGFLILALMVSQLAIVVLRYVFSVGTQWGQDLLVYLFMVASVLPLVLVVLRNLNVRVDVYYVSFPEPVKAWLDRFGLLCLFMPAMAYTAYVSWSSVLNSWRIGEGSATLGGLPGLYVLKALQMGMFGLLAVTALLLCTRRRPWNYEADSKEPDA